MTLPHLASDSSIASHLKFSGHAWWNKNTAKNSSSRRLPPHLEPLCSGHVTSVPWSTLALVTHATHAIARLPKTTTVLEGQTPSTFAGVFISTTTIKCLLPTDGVWIEMTVCGWMGRKVHRQSHWNPLMDVDFSETSDSGGCVLSLPGPLGPGAYLNLGGPFSFGYDKPFAVEFFGEFPKGSSNTS